MRVPGWIALATVLATSVSGASLEITIDPVFNGEPLKLDSLRHETAAGETLSFTRVGVLLGGFALERDDGQWTEVPGAIAWMDAASRRNTVLLEGLPTGKFRSLRFHVGPDAVSNAADVTQFPADHPLNPNVNGLHWSWQGGYIFMAIEGLFRCGNGEPKGFAHHLARDPNRTRVSLGTALDLDHDAGVLIHFDLATLFNAPRVLSFESDGAATHSRPGDPVAAALVANLPGAFRVIRTVSTAPPAAVCGPVVPIDLPVRYTPWRFTMSRTFPVPDLPLDNPLIEERVSLGEALFHESMLSRDGTISCATCHQPGAAFTDGLVTSRGVDGRTGDRNAMPLFNLAWKRRFFWDGRASSLREQVLMPIADHREMDESVERVCNKLAASPSYVARFGAAFGMPGISGEKISLALEQYLLTLGARDSRFDRAMAGRAALSDAEKRGFELFMTEYEPRTGQRGADCFHCHGGALFTDHQFHNNGLDGRDRGLAAVTGSPADERKFATPSLRNVALTAPYMHDGRFTTLEQVIDHYSAGVRRGPTLDPNLAKHPAAGLGLSRADKAALVAFLRTLTEEKSSAP